MGSAADKANGMGNQVAGNVKKGIGDAVGNDRLKAEGQGQVQKGKAQEAVGNVKATIKDAVNKTL